MGEEYSEKELYDQGSMSVGGPFVVTFQDPGKKSEVSASERAIKKAFMVRNSLQAPTRLTQPPPASVVENFQTPARIPKPNKESKIW